VVTASIIRAIGQFLRDYRLNIPEDRHLHTRRHGDLKSYVLQSDTQALLDELNANLFEDSEDSERKVNSYQQYSRIQVS
jgi:hypothetical protein